MALGLQIAKFPSPLAIVTAGYGGLPGSVTQTFFPGGSGSLVCLALLIAGLLHACIHSDGGEPGGTHRTIWASFLSLHCLPYKSPFLLTGGQLSLQYGDSSSHRLIPGHQESGVGVGAAAKQQPECTFQHDSHFVLLQECSTLGTLQSAELIDTRRMW